MDSKLPTPTPSSAPPVGKSGEDSSMNTGAPIRKSSPGIAETMHEGRVMVTCLSPTTEDFTLSQEWVSRVTGPLKRFVMSSSQPFPTTPKENSHELP